MKIIRIADADRAIPLTGVAIETHKNVLGQFYALTYVNGIIKNRKTTGYCKTESGAIASAKRGL